MRWSSSRWKGLVIATVLALTAVGLAACTGEDRPGSVTVDSNGNVSVSASASGSGSASGSVSALGTGSGSVSGSVSNSGAGGGGTAFEIYTPVSNVDGYFNFALDRRDMLDLISAGDFAGARDIYVNGRNFVRGDGTRRPLQSIATDANVLAQFPNGAEAYGSEQFLDPTILQGLDGTGRGADVPDGARRQLVDKGLQMVFLGKALQELDAARDRVEAGNTDDATGAPHAVDEAAALYLGAADADGNRPWSLANTAASREGNFGLEGRLDLPLRHAFVDALRAAQAGDLPAYEDAQSRVEGYLNSIFYLASLRYGLSALNAPVETRAVQLNEGWTFFQSIRAVVHAAAPQTADRINELYSSAPASVPGTISEEIYDGLNDPAVLQALGVPQTLVVMEPPQ